MNAAREQPARTTRARANKAGGGEQDRCSIWAASSTLAAPRVCAQVHVAASPIATRCHRVIVSSCHRVSGAGAVHDPATGTIVRQFALPNTPWFCITATGVMVCTNQVGNIACC